MGGNEQSMDWVVEQVQKSMEVQRASNLAKAYSLWQQDAWEQFKCTPAYKGQGFDTVDICEDGTVYVKTHPNFVAVVITWEDYQEVNCICSTCYGAEDDCVCFNLDTIHGQVIL